MNWTSFLKSEVEDAYRMALGLMKMVEEDSLGWKPATGDNWMTTGQLLKHMVASCGACCKGVVTGDWGVPPEDMPEDEASMLPPAEKLPTVASVNEAIQALEADKLVALAMIEEVGEDGLATRELTLPWGSSGTIGKHLLDMIYHLNNHKSQLFYYLKLQGKPVNTHHMYGMPTS
ncbi:DinB family protein [Candidatus Eisenbacteria bacterium]|uniref:DinB family protein n=1 Tax=Eiseniibacteriota bacterium TaxID=2212470 RepID=A0ABV6YIK6_UNCEI